MIRVAGTGHRPEKLQIQGRNAYNSDVFQRVWDLARAALSRYGDSHTVVITGMAQGWDTALALAARDLGLSYWAYVPFPGQELQWPAPAQDLYNELLETAATINYIRPSRPQTKREIVRALFDRNEAMMADADWVLALYDGSETGGTHQAVDYARKRGLLVRNVWSYWERHKDRENVSS